MYNTMVLVTMQCICVTVSGGLARASGYYEEVNMEETSEMSGVAEQEESDGNNVRSTFLRHLITAHVV